MSRFNLPDQTIPESKKDKEWHISHVLEYVNYTLNDFYQNQKKEMLKLYRGYNAELSEDEEALVKSITCPNGYNLGVEYIVYPLIQTKIEQLVGEFLLRPLRRKAYVIDKKSKNKKFEKKLKLISEEIMRDLLKEIQPDLGYKPETENPEIELPPDIEEFFEKDFKTIAEEVADGFLNLFLDVRKEKHKFKELFLDYCITDRCHAVLEKKFGHTSMRKVHPLDADYDIDPYKIVQDNHEYFFENYYLTENEIYNTFELKEDQKDKIKEIFSTLEPGAESVYTDSLTYSKKYNGWFSTSNKVNRLRVVSLIWKSRKRISIKESKSKKGKTFYKKIDEKYIVRKKDIIKHIDGEEPRHVIMLGPEICLSYGKMKNRYSYVDTPWQCTLPVISLIRDNSTGTSLIKSPASKLYQLQQIASEVLFEIRLALKTAGDKRVLVYDAAQTPKAFTKGGFENGLNRVMHHIKKDKLMIINSKEKGAKNSFNQFTSLNLSQEGAVQDLFNGLAIIEDLASKFIGISPEREGQIGQYQTATGTDRAIRGSTARTEIFFNPFDEFIQALLEKVLMKAKKDYEEGEVIHFIFGEMKTKFLKLYKEFFLSDLGMYLSNARKDQEASQRIDIAAERALANATDPSILMGLIEVFEGETAVEKKAVFQRMLNTMNKMAEERNKSLVEQSKIEAQKEIAKEKEQADLKREGYQKDIEVAKIYVKGKGMSDLKKTTTQEKIAAAKINAELLKKEKDKK